MKQREETVNDTLLVSKRSASQMLSVSLRTIDNLVARGDLPVRRIGRRVLIARKTLVQFARSDHQTRQRGARTQGPQVRGDHNGKN